jgi:hypothetical protein
LYLCRIGPWLSLNSTFCPVACNINKISEKTMTASTSNLVIGCKDTVVESFIFKQNFIESKELDLIQTQDYTPFLEQIQDGSDINQIARSFYNKSGDTLLIIPYPHQTIQYTTIKEFIDNAPENIKSEFWKFTVDQIKQFILTHGQVYVSTHGLGVNYFHLRLCTYPKYYQSVF